MSAGARTATLMNQPAEGGETAAAVVNRRMTVGVPDPGSGNVDVVGASFRMAR